MTIFWLYVTFVKQVKTNWDDLENLKRKKMTTRFYQNIKRGVQLIKEGNTAYHTEYNQIFPYFSTFSDDHICKLQHVDTVPVVSLLTIANHFKYKVQY